MESISVSCDDKLKISQHLSKFNIDYIEAGWPGSNPKDEEFFLRAQSELDDVTRGKLVAFGSTRRKGIMAKDDAQIEKLVESGGELVVVCSGLWSVIIMRLCVLAIKNLSRLIFSLTSYAQHNTTHKQYHNTQHQQSVSWPRHTYGKSPTLSVPIPKKI